MIRPFVLLASCLLLACSPNTEPGPSKPAAPTREVPPNAVKIADDLYMVPLDQPVEGCPAYRQFSTTKMVNQAIYYRARQGGFTFDRNEAVCD